MRPRHAGLISALMATQLALGRAELWVRGAQGSQISVDPDATQAPPFNVTLNGVAWLQGTLPAFRCDGVWLQVGHGLSLQATDTTSQPNSLTWTWKADASGAVFNTTFEFNPTSNVFFFHQHFVDGCKQAAPSWNPSKLGEFNSSLTPTSTFPSFDTAAPALDNLRFYSWRGRFMHDFDVRGTGLDGFQGGQEGGPLLLHTDDASGFASALVLSPANNFMDSSLGMLSACQLQPRAADCTIEQGVDYFGNDLDMHPNTQTLDACCSLCKANPSCMAFSWANESDPQYAYDCWLKTSTAGRRPESHTSGYLCDDTAPGTLVAGVQGQIESVPAGYSQSFIISPLTGMGVTAAMYKWGNALRTMHNTSRLSPDPVSTQIGYATDNGGYWYGNHVPTAENLTAVVESIAALNISLGSLQLDPFWYHNGDGNTDNCALSWQPRADLFPQGLVAFRKAIGGMPLILYSSLWCSTTQFVPDFASHGFRFLNSTLFNAGFDKGIFAQADPDTAFAFYDYIFTEHAAEINGGGFETDFMDFSALLIPEFNTQLGVAAGWLAGMWGAAAKHGLPSQQCMSLPSMILNALDHPAVTNARASEDDFPDNPNRWQIGYTALFLGPVAVRPFFDVLWTQAVQPGNPYGLAHRSNVELEVVVATLSMGPVWIGDGAGFTNKTLVDQFAAANGSLLHPSRPATPVDAMYTSTAPQDAEVWSTFTLAPAASGLNASSHMVLVVDVTEPFKLPLASLWPYSPISPATAAHTIDGATWLPCSDGSTSCKRAAANIKVVATGGWYVSSYNAPCVAGMLSSDCLEYVQAGQDALNVHTGKLNSTTGDHAWDLLTLVPELGPGFAFLGLRDTLVRASPQRVTAIAISDSNVHVTVAGTPLERVAAAFLVPSLNPSHPGTAGNGTVVWRSNAIGADGTAVLSAVPA